jgi:hypothetical protein
MAVKLVSAVIAVVLLVAYLIPLVSKLKDVALWSVVLLGLAMMAVDLWQSLQKPDS